MNGNRKITPTERKFKDAYEAVEKQQNNPKDNPIIIEYPLSVPAGSTRRIDFEIPEKWESHLAAITCLTVETTQRSPACEKGLSKTLTAL